MIRTAESRQREKDRGFEIFIDGKGELVTIRVWGLWDETLAQRFEQEFFHKIDTIPAHERKWNLLMDFTNFSNNSKTIEQIFGNILHLAKQKGMSQKAIVARHIAMPHLLHDLSHDPGLRIDFFFQGHSEARQWLLSV